MRLEDILTQIAPAEQRAMAEAKRRWDAVAHPLNSLGMLETDVIRIAGMTGSPNIDISKRAVVVMCADNGVVEEGVTQTGQDVSRGWRRCDSCGHWCRPPGKGREDPPEKYPAGNSQYDPRSGHDP